MQQQLTHTRNACACGLQAPCTSGASRPSRHARGTIIVQVGAAPLPSPCARRCVPLLGPRYYSPPTNNSIPTPLRQRERRRRERRPLPLHL